MSKIDLTRPVIPARLPENASLKVPGNKDGHVSFDRVLQQTMQNTPVRFSQHAEKRMHLRNISLTPEAIKRLERAVDKAAQKGARESLVLLDNLALIVSIANRTVITAIDGPNIKENVFTNIDSAVIT